MNSNVLVILHICWYRCSWLADDNFFAILESFCGSAHVERDINAISIILPHLVNEVVFCLLRRNCVEKTA